MVGRRQNEDSQSTGASSSSSFFFGLFLQLLHSWISILIILDLIFKSFITNFPFKKRMLYSMGNITSWRSSYCIRIIQDITISICKWNILQWMRGSWSMLNYYFFNSLSIRYHRCEFKLQLPTKATSVDNSRLVDLSPTFITVGFQFTYMFLRETNVINYLRM